MDNNNVSLEHLRSMDDEARRLIDDVLVPEFKKLCGLYPEAKSWNVSIGIYNDSQNDDYEVITFALVDPELGADNPGASKFNVNPYGNLLKELMPIISHILKDEEKQYGITVDDEPLEAERLNLYCYTKFNHS